MQLACYTKTKLWNSDTYLLSHRPPSWGKEVFLRQVARKKMECAFLKGWAVSQRALRKDSLPHPLPEDRLSPSSSSQRMRQWTIGRGGLLHGPFIWEQSGQQKSQCYGLGRHMGYSTIWFIRMIRSHTVFLNTSEGFPAIPKEEALWVHCLQPKTTPMKKTFGVKCSW